MILDFGSEFRFIVSFLINNSLNHLAFHKDHTYDIKAYEVLVDNPTMWVISL